MVKQSSIMKRLMKGSSNKNISNFIDSDVMNVDSFIDSGNYILNGLLSCDLYGGMPEGRMVELSGDSGTGKSQPLSEPVLTPYGFKPMGEIKPNDYVIGEDGNPVKVISIHPQGELDVYEITFNDGSKTRCSIDHLWSVKTINDIRRNNSSRIMTTKELIEGYKKRSYYIPICDKINFIKRDVLLDPYIIGALIGDGSLANGFASFSNSNEFIIDKIRSRLDSDTELVYKSKYDYNFRKKESGKDKNSVYKSIVHYNLNKLSDQKFIPEDYLYNDVETRIQLLNGLMDTDGSFDTRNGKSPYYCTTSYKLSDDFIFLIQSLGGTAKRNIKRDPKFKYKNEIKTGKDLYIVSFNLPNIEIFTLPYKKDGYKQNSKYMPVRIIKDIKKMGKEEQQCIFVDSKSHLYLTKNCIVTHNTLVITSILKNFIKSSENNIAIFFDSELGANVSELKSSLTEEQFYNQFLHHEVQTYEQLIQYSAEQLQTMTEMKQENNELKFLVVLDSLSALLPQSQINKILKGEDTKIMNEQQLIKIFFNNIRTPLAKAKAGFIFANHVYLDTMNAGKYTSKLDRQITRGGQGVMYTPDIKIRLFKKNLKDEEKNQIGIQVEAYATKSRLVALNTQVNFHVKFKTGVDRYSGLWDFMLENGVIKKTGAGAGTKYCIEELNWEKSPKELKEINKMSELFNSQMIELANKKFKELYKLESINELSDENIGE